MKPTSPSLILLVLFSIFGLQLKAETTSSIVNGDWHNPAIWSGGSVPVCGDYIIISAGHTVTVGEQVNLDAASGCTLTTFIHIAGNLIFENGNKIRLTCGSELEVMAGASMQPGSGGGSSNLLEICGTIEWKTSDGTVNGYEHFGSPLPLASEFKSFNVEKKQDELFSFVWVINAALNVHSYEIYQSNNGADWTLIADQVSIGDHNDEYVYSNYYQVFNKCNGIVYFKLVEVNNNGTKTQLALTSYSEQENDLMVYPNPVQGQNSINVSMKSTIQEDRTLTLTNSLGQTVFQNTIVLNKGINLQKIDVNEFQSGVYFLKINNDDTIHKIIINK